MKMDAEYGTIIGAQNCVLMAPKTTVFGGALWTIDQDEQTGEYTVEGSGIEGFIAPDLIVDMKTVPMSVAEWTLA